MNHRHGNVSFSKRIVEEQAAFCRRLCIANGFWCRIVPVKYLQVITVCHKRIGESEIWIFLDCLPKVVDRFPKSFLRSLIPEVKTHEIRLIRGGVCGVMFPQIVSLVGSKINCKRSDDVVGNRVLNTEDVGKRLVEFFRPNSAAAGDVNELHNGPDLIPGPLNSSTQ